MAKQSGGTAKAKPNIQVTQKRGQGHGVNYKPWLYVQNVPSLGLATRERGWKTKRAHHLMSQLEHYYFYALEWSPIVVDIREQFPLDIDLTIAIAARLGVKHPADPKTKEPYVMTTDFLITLQDSARTWEEARSVKPSEDLSSRRTLEKLEIERVYWEMQNIGWGIVTEKEIDKVLAENVKWLHPFLDAAELAPLTQEDIRRVESVLVKEVVNGHAPLRDITNLCDDRVGLQPGSSLSVVRHLIATRRWAVHMGKRITPNERLELINVSAAAVLERKVG